MALSLSTSAYADAYSAPAGYARPFSWTGLYIGANAGWVDENVNWRNRDAGTGVVATFCPTIVAGGSGCDIGRQTGIYGVHAGVNHQMHGGLVVGIEGAVSWPQNGFGRESCLGGGGFNCEARTNFLATIGPRLGWGIGNFLIYGSGGFAHGQIDTQLTFTGIGPIPGFSTRGGHDGWYLGAGIEYAITRHIILGVEYQHIELNNNLDRVARDASILDKDIHADYDIVRARLSYKFGTEERARPLK